MSITATYVKQIAPEFSDTDDSRINLLISEAENSIDSDVYDSKTNLATAYLVAHMLSVTTPFDPDGGGGGIGGGGSMVTSSKVGDLSETYSETTGGSSSSSSGLLSGDESLKMTTYGRELLRLRGETARAYVPMLLD